MIICDTGPLVAAAINDDAHHRECVDLFTALHLAERAILIPALVVAETGYLIGRDGGPTREAEFLDSLTDGAFSVVDLAEADYQRAAELVRTYADLRLGTTDAAVVAVCERLGIPEVATLDRRHFTVVRPRHVNALRLLPD